MFSHPFRVSEAHAHGAIFSRRGREREDFEHLVSYETKLGSYRCAGFHKVRKQVKFENPPKRRTHERVLFARASPTIMNKTSASAEGASGKKIWIFGPEILKKYRKFDPPRPNLGKVDPPQVKIWGWLTKKVDPPQIEIWGGEVDPPLEKSGGG